MKFLKGGEGGGSDFIDFGRNNKKRVIKRFLVE